MFEQGLATLIGAVLMPEPASLQPETQSALREPALLDVQAVTKTFAGTVAVEDVSFSLPAGQVVALVGENGAGKSTCVNILGGVYRPDGGALCVGGSPVELHSPLDAQRLGVAVVHQHPGLFPDLSIAENLFAGRLRRNVAGLVDHAGMRREAAGWLRKLGLRQEPAAPVGSLRTSEQQMVEIARALAARARVLVLDEPTAALSVAEVDKLFAVIRQLRSEGVAILFVGHRLEEIFAIADQLVVLRDGRHVATRRVRDVTQPELVRLMVGRPLADLYPRTQTSPGDVVLSVDHLSAASGLHDLSLQLRAGEIVGLAGLVGSGRTELARVLFGVERASSGTMSLDGKAVRLRSAADALAHGIAYVSEDRRGQSLVESFSILDNATLPVVGKATRFALVRRRMQLALVAGPLQQMRLRFRDYDQPAGTLAGGNQQKVVLAKWLATQPRVLILDEPTQGIDVQAKADVHRIMSGLVDSGLAILLISSDLPEVLGMSDRVVVMRRGRIAGEFTREEASQEQVALAATGASDVPSESSLADRDHGHGDGPAVSPTRRHRVAARVAVTARRREAGLVAALLATVVPISLVNPRFLTPVNLRSVASEAALVGVVALGQFLVVITRNIDLSVGSVIGLSAYVFGSFAKHHQHTGVILPLLVALALGLLCGVVNGLTVSYGQVPAIVATLGTLYVYRGVDSILSNGKEIAPGDIPPSIERLTAGSLLGVPTLAWVCLALFAGAGVCLRWTARGRELYQVGSNPEGARLIGVPARRRILVAFGVSGMLAGLDGALWAGHYGIIDGQSAYGLELTAVAAVVVGGVALRGGYGTVVGVALGTIALFTIQNALELARVDSNDLQAFYGAAILLAVGLDLLIVRRSRHRQAVV
jgi:ABC-type sugar transport system ATPase subunit/ribose/xylose/arabinose/galactoside ABC-type transport system permease subunit